MPAGPHDASGIFTVLDMVHLSDLRRLSGILVPARPLRHQCPENTRPWQLHPALPPVHAVPFRVVLFRRHAQVITILV